MMAVGEDEGPRREQARDLLGARPGQLPQRLSRPPWCMRARERRAPHALQRARHLPVSFIEKKDRAQIGVRGGEQAPAILAWAAERELVRKDVSLGAGWDQLRQAEDTAALELFALVLKDLGVRIERGLGIERQGAFGAPAREPPRRGLVARVGPVLVEWQLQMNDVQRIP